MTGAKEFSFSDKTKKKFYRDFLRSVDAMARAYKMDVDQISISEVAFGAALREAEIDLSFVQKRRDFEGPSIGKMAGCLLFRLCRHRVLHLVPPACEHGHADDLQDAAALDFVIVSVLKIPPAAPAIHGGKKDERASTSTKRDMMFPNLWREIFFLLRRRHYNQELLGMMFDSMRIAVA